MNDEKKIPTPRSMPKKMAAPWRSYVDPKTGAVNGPVIHGGTLAYSTSTTPAFKAPDEELS